MHPEHNCSADCETLHREICKKLLSLLLSRLQPVQEPAKGTNTWVKVTFCFVLLCFPNCFPAVWTGLSARLGQQRKPVQVVHLWC